MLDYYFKYVLYIFAIIIYNYLGPPAVCQRASEGGSAAAAAAQLGVAPGRPGEESEQNPHLPLLLSPRLLLGNSHGCSCHCGLCLWDPHRLPVPLPAGAGRPRSVPPLNPNNKQNICSWESANAGKLPHHVDWSTWAEEEEEDE